MFFNGNLNFSRNQELNRINNLIKTISHIFVNSQLANDNKRKNFRLSLLKINGFLIKIGYDRPWSNMDEKTEEIAVAMMANFEAKRLNETKRLIELTNNQQYQHYLATQNNPRITDILNQKSKQVQQLQRDLDLLLLRQTRLFPSPEAKIHSLEIYNSQKEVTDYLIAVKAKQDLEMQINEIKKENKELQKELEKYEKINRKA